MSTCILRNVAESEDEFILLTKYSLFALRPIQSAVFMDHGLEVGCQDD